MPGGNDYQFDPNDPDQIKSKLIFFAVAFGALLIARFVFGIL